MSSDVIDTVVSRSRPPDLIPLCSVETATPVVEIEEPLLSSLEVMELVQQTKYSLEMEGFIVTLFTEDGDPILVGLLRLIISHFK